MLVSQPVSDPTTVSLTDVLAFLVDAETQDVGT